MQWTLNSAGEISGIKVLRSQLDQPSFHQCIASEISKLHFPSPQGGSVTIKYPFSFSTQ
jgi:hypothetical protein